MRPRPTTHVHVRKLKNECVIRRRARRRVVAPAGGSAMPSLLGLGLGTRACGPRSLLLGMESRSGVSAPQCTCINTNSGLQPTAQQARPWSTRAAANRGQDDHGWKEGRIEEEEGSNKGKVRNSKSHTSQTLNTPSTLINLSPRKTSKRRVRIPPRYDTQQLKNRTRHTNTVVKHNTHAHDVQARKRKRHDEQSNQLQWAARPRPPRAGKTDRKTGRDTQKHKDMTCKDE